jgi:hypothetical protein
VLPKRFAKYGLTLHPDKTRLVAFHKPDWCPGQQPPGGQRPGTFDVLGFTHHWAGTRRGTWAVKRKTAKSRFKRSLASIAHWCRRNRHLPIRDQWQALGSKLRGHYAYYGIIGNAPSLQRTRYHVLCVWWKWLRRRSQKSRLPWEKFGLLVKRYPLPAPRLPRSRTVP